MAGEYSCLSLCMRISVKVADHQWGSFQAQIIATTHLINIDSLSGMILRCVKWKSLSGYCSINNTGNVCILLSSVGMFAFHRQDYPWDRVFKMAIRRLLWSKKVVMHLHWWTYQLPSAPCRLEWLKSSCLFNILETFDRISGFWPGLYFSEAAFDFPLDKSEPWLFPALFNAILQGQIQCSCCIQLSSLTFYFLAGIVEGEAEVGMAIIEPV